MRYSGLLEFYLSEFGIIFLYCDVPESWEYLESHPEIISLPYSLYGIVGVFAIVVIENSTPSAVVYEINWNERSR